MPEGLNILCHVATGFVMGGGNKQAPAGAAKSGELRR